MSALTSIEWTDRTWGPTRGCSRVSAGCDNCYAMRMAHRFNFPGGAYEGLTRIGKRGVDWNGKVRLVPDALDEPLRWRKPQRVFVNSMSDLFHESLDFKDIAAVFGIMACAPQHTFQILTKRPARMLEFCRRMEDMPAFWMAQALWRQPVNYVRALDVPMVWPLPNVWNGTSVEDQATADERIPLLINTPAAVRFVSYEPALGPVNFRAWTLAEHGRRHIGARPGLGWIIVGGESGPNARPFDVEWARSTVLQCKAAGVPVFVKQLGAWPLMRWVGGPLLNDGRSGSAYGDRCALGIYDKKGGDPSEWPEDLRVREYPA